MDKSTDINLLQSGAIAHAESQCEILKVKSKNAFVDREVQCQLIGKFPDTRSVGTSPKSLVFCSAKNEVPIEIKESNKKKIGMFLDNEKENNPKIDPIKFNHPRKFEKPTAELYEAGSFDEEYDDDFQKELKKPNNWTAI